MSEDSTLLESLEALHEVSTYADPPQDKHRFTVMHLESANYKNHIDVNCTTWKNGLKRNGYNPLNLKRIWRVHYYAGNWANLASALNEGVCKSCAKNHLADINAAQAYDFICKTGQASRNLSRRITSRYPVSDEQMVTYVAEFKALTVQTAKALQAYGVPDRFKKVGKELLIGSEAVLDLLNQVYSPEYMVKVRRHHALLAVLFSQSGVVTSLSSGIGLGRESDAKLAPPQILLASGHDPMRHLTDLINKPVDTWDDNVDTVIDSYLANPPHLVSAYNVFNIDHSPATGQTIADYLKQIYSRQFPAILTGWLDTLKVKLQPRTSIPVKVSATFSTRRANSQEYTARRIRDLVATHGPATDYDKPANTMTVSAALPIQEAQIFYAAANRYSVPVTLEPVCAEHKDTVLFLENMIKTTSQKDIPWEDLLDVAALGTQTTVSKLVACTPVEYAALTMKTAN